MVRQRCILFLMLALIICSCNGNVVREDSLRDSSAAYSLFQQAESLFQRQLYKDALRKYNQYLSLFPEGSTADLALVRVAAIYSEQKDDEARHSALQQLISKYPNSKYAADAMLEELNLLYTKGRFNEAIRLAALIIRTTESRKHNYQAYLVIGDIHQSRGAATDAVLFYHLACQAARGDEKAAASGKLNAALAQLSPDQVQSLLSDTDDENLRGYIVYQLALNRYEKKDYPGATRLLSEFIKRFPGHEKEENATLLIDDIKQRLTFKRGLIGCLLPLSGTFKTFGQRALKAIEFALDEYNTQNNQTQLELSVRDTGSDPEFAAMAVRQLDEENVALIIGPMITSSAAAREAQEREIPIITLTQREGICDIGDYVFRNFLTPKMQIDALVPFAVERLGIRRFAVLYPLEDYGTVFMNTFVNKVRDYGANVVAVQSYNSDQTDFSEPIRKLSKFSHDKLASDETPHNGRRSGKTRHRKSEVDLDFDAIFIPDSSTKASMIAPQLAYYDVNNVLMMGTNLWHSDALIKEAGRYIQYALIADGFFPDAAGTNVSNFIADYEAYSGEKPGLIEAFAYDTARIAFSSLNNSTLASRKDVKAALSGFYDFDGITGPTTFNENGEARKKLYLLQVDGDKFVELETF